MHEELTFEDFSDNFAQTLTYSLFLARLNNSSKEIDLYNAKKFIPKSFPLIRAMSGFLENLEDLDSIKWLLEEILHIINHIDITSIIKELNKISEKDALENYTTQYTHKDPYLHFYETFLSQYDPRLREIRGVYYTPAPVVSFIINAIDAVLKSEFDKEGLSEAVEEDSNITLLDFATGTGTFLLEAFRKALESIPLNSPKYAPKNLLEKFKGFEFLISPYTIAHLKISQTFKEEFHAPLEDDEKLNIRLTNTLYFRDFKLESNEKADLFAPIPALAEEAFYAQTIKENPILIITGNPPYSGASANKGLYEDNVRIAYGLEPSEADLSKSEQKHIELYLQNPQNTQYKKSFKAILERKKLKNEKNPKWLLDDYVKFIRFAESKIAKQPSGIFAFIANNSFLDNPTFRGMRYHLLKTFDSIYILDLHGNARKKESTPSGEKDDNVFDIMQGVSINIFIKNKNASNTRIYDSNFHRPNSCHSTTSPCHSEALAEESQGKNKRDISLVSQAQYDKVRDSRDISAFSKPQYDKVCHSATSPCHIENPSCHSEYSEESKKRYFANAQYDKVRDSNPSLCHSEALAEESQNKGKRDISLVSQAQYDKSCHSEALAEESQSNAEWVENFTQEFRDFIDSKYQWEVADYDNYPDFFMFNACDSNTRYFAPTQYDKVRDSRDISAFSKPQYDKVCHSERSEESQNKGKTDISHSLVQSARISPSLANMTKETLTKSPKAEFILTPEAILGYIYAVLFHKDYREKYLDFLKIDFPKIPFVESKEKFLALSALGCELINIHLMRHDRQTDRQDANENGLQYWVGGVQANREQGIRTQLHSAYDNGDVLYIQQNKRGQLSLSSLSLQKGINMGLVCDRGSKLQEINNIFITQSIIDLHLVGSGSYVFPLYLKKE
ncbi:type ISP restriction/modification enzyme [Helicobacter himalayensis]|uniref:type ISP restriction/modification enzyme n=1 Tax=Helicobacter himalayensis TaxID=1591088 RepID=UPI003D6E48F0